MAIVAAISGELTIDRAPLPAQVFGDLCGRMALLSESGNRIPLFLGDLVIAHGRLPLLGGGEKRPLSQITHLWMIFVAVSI